MASSGNATRKQPAAKRVVNPRGFFPPSLPPEYRRLIDGETCFSVRIEYTVLGIQTLAVLNREGTLTAPMEQFIAGRKAASASKAAQHLRDLYQVRISERGIKGVILPPFSSKESLEVFIEALSPSISRLLKMSNRNFRAFKGTNTPE